MKNAASNHKPLTILRCKVVMVGDACVGKTAITQVFQGSGSVFPKSYMMVQSCYFRIDLRLSFLLDYWSGVCS